MSSDNLSEGEREDFNYRQPLPPPPPQTQRRGGGGHRTAMVPMPSAMFMQNQPVPASIMAPPNPALDHNVRLWQKALRLEFLLLNLVDLNKRQKKTMDRKIGVLSKLLNHEGFSASYIAQCIAGQIYALGLHKAPESILASQTKRSLAEIPWDQQQQQAELSPSAKRVKQGDDTDSDQELNAEARGATKQREPVMKTVDRVKLDVPAVLRAEGVPPTFVANHQQILGQLFPGKGATSNKTQ